MDYGIGLTKMIEAEITDKRNVKNTLNGWLAIMRQSI